MSQFIEMFGTVENNTHNFPIMTIGEFANCFAGATPSTSHPEYWENGRIRWMSSGEVHKGHVEDTDFRITELGYKSASTRMVPIHSIVIAIAGQGKTRGTVAITEVDLCTNQSLCAIVPDERVNYLYLYHNLQGRYLELRGLSGDVNGRGGLNLKIIQKIPVILPPIEKQQQFASIAQQADKSKFGDFKSQFIEMFGTVENNTHNFPIMTIGEFANCFAGATPSTSHPEYWENGRIRWMSSGEVHKGHVEDTDFRITELGYKSASTRMVPIHSIVIAIAGQGKTRGTVAITEVDLCTNQSLCAIVPDERVNYLYLYHNLQGRYLELRGLSGDVNGRGGLNLKIIQKIPVILPPIEKQQQFASIAQQADKSKSVIQKALVYLNDIQSDELGKIA